MHTYTIAEICQHLKSGDYSSVEISEYLLDRIKRLNADNNAFIEVTEEAALTAAELADKQRASGAEASLLGVPIAHKDIFCMIKGSAIKVALSTLQARKRGKII